MDKTVTTGREFGRALCRHFGLPTDQVAADIKVAAAPNDIFSVSLTINLTADDLSGIADQLRAEQDGV